MENIKEKELIQVTVHGETTTSWKCPKCNYVKVEKSNNIYKGDTVQCRNPKCRTNFKVV